MKTNKKVMMLLLAFLLLFGTVGGTLAFLVTSTQSVENTFTPSEIDVEIEEDFDGVNKTNIKVTNTGDTDGYFRVKLVGYWHDEAGKIMAKNGWFSDTNLTLGTNWLKGNDGYYYYALPIAPNQTSASPLFIEEITLLEDDEDETKQVLEIIADGIQSKPKEAFDAWAPNSGIAWCENALTK